jgi:hypothetical protein
MISLDEPGTVAVISEFTSPEVQPPMLPEQSIYAKLPDLLRAQLESSTEARIICEEVIRSGTRRIDKKRP